MKQYEEAIASHNTVRYKPDHYAARYSRGNALFNLKRYQGAIASSDKAVLFKLDDKEAIDVRTRTQNQLALEKVINFA